MYIANLLGTSTSSALEAVYGQKKKGNNDDNAQSGVYSWREDRINFSEAALALAQLAGKDQAPSEDESRDALNGQNLGDDALASESADESEEAVAAAGSGQQSSPGGGSSASDIEAKIKQLQQKIVETQNSDLPEDTKTAMISALQAQIGELVQEKSALENQA